VRSLAGRLAMDGHYRVVALLCRTSIWILFFGNPGICVTCSERTTGPRLVLAKKHFDPPNPTPRLSG